MIEKLKTDKDPGFNSIAVAREIRGIKLKLNEVIDELNRLSEPIYTDDLDLTNPDDLAILHDEDSEEEETKKKVKKK